MAIAKSNVEHPLKVVALCCLNYYIVSGNVLFNSTTQSDIRRTLSCLLAHVFFDDATELNEEEEYVPNPFVKQFLEVIDEAGRYVPTRSSSRRMVQTMGCVDKILYRFLPESSVGRM